MKRTARLLASYSTIIEPLIFPGDNKEAALPRFNIRWKLWKSGRAAGGFVS